jgi:hypothetical protein
MNIYKNKKISGKRNRSLTRVSINAENSDRFIYLSSKIVLSPLHKLFLVAIVKGCLNF